MAKVTTVFTYTIPAVAGATVPPPAPINCGCADFLLILEDRSLLQTPLRGILTTTIKNVAVSSTPVSYVEPSSGVSMLVWKYDYTLEYDTDDLTDPDFRVRRCDVIQNCCRGCAQEYTDRRLEGNLQGVTGSCVDNTDPFHPIINPTSLSGNIVAGGPCAYTVNQTITSLARIGSSTSIRYVNENGTNTDIDLCPIVTSCYSGVPQILPQCGITWNPSNQFLGVDTTGTWGVAPLNFIGTELNGAEIYCASDGLRTHPPHYGHYAETGASDPSPVALSVAGHTRVSPIASLVVTNNSPTRTFLGRVCALGRAFGGLTAGTVAEIAFNVAIDNGGGVLIGNGKRTALDANVGPANFRWDFEYGWDRIFAIPPLTTQTFRAQTTMIANIMTGGAYGFDGAIDVGLTFVGHTQ